MKEAGIRDVIRRIIKRVRDDARVEELARKVRENEDLTLEESRELYRDVDFGDKLPLSKKRDLDVDWTDHAEYRGELRDIDSDKFNEAIRDWLKERLIKKGPDSKKVKMKLPGKGTAVVDYDLKQKPADADVVTVWASREKRITAALLEKIPREYATLWYENDKGDRIVPDLRSGGPEPMPDGYNYQVSRFPTQLDTNHLRILKQEDVDACAHEDDLLEKDMGIIDSMEGRTCRKCGGYQSKQKGEPWPETWEAYGSKPVFSMSQGWQEDLALCLVKQGFGLSAAIVVAACCCERCMNVLADECGLDWGYPEGSEDYEKCGTSCALCEGKEL